MDALTFATPVLLRKMTFANASKSDIQQMDYAKALIGLNLSRPQFVDLCIMLGCDYCDSIRGVGPKTALKLIREHNDIETILATIDRKKYGVPDTWIPNEVREEALKKEREEKEAEEYDTDKEKEEEDIKVDAATIGVEPKKEEDDSSDEKEEELIPVFVQARGLFNEHEVTKNCDLKWTPCKPVELTKYLVEDMGFNAERVQSSIEKLQKAFKATCKPQTRMDSFFKVKPGIASTLKRKAVPVKNEKKGKKGAGSFGRKKR